MLVEKIVKLQRELAKRQEKLDFMEEHVSTMVTEMKKKNKLLQSLMLKQEAGALASQTMDENKVRFLLHFIHITCLEMNFLLMQACHDKDCFRGGKGPNCCFL